jgi:hypothetical protein
MKKIVISLLFEAFNCIAGPKEEMQQVDLKYVGQLEDKKFDPIRTKFPLAPNGQATLPMLSDASRASTQQKKALEAYQIWGKEYTNELKEIFLKFVPQQSENIEWRYQQSLKLVSDVYSGKLNWGDFNKQWSEVGPEYQRRVAATNSVTQQQQITQRNQQLQAQAQQEQAERNKKAQYCQSLVQFMQLNCKPQPVYGGTPLSDLANSINNFNPAMSFDCGRAQSMYSNSCL